MMGGYGGNGVGAGGGGGGNYATMYGGQFYSPNIFGKRLVAENETEGIIL